jgi:hypothetical protein
MSKPAIVTLYAVAFIVSVVFAYGTGHKHGRHAQLSFDQIVDICAAQFFDLVKQRQKR